MEEPKLVSVLNADLSDFEIRIVYGAERDTGGLMGTFPALVSSIDQPFVCLDLELLKKVVSLLEPRDFKVTEIFAIVNLAENYAFDLRFFGERKWKEKLPLKVLTEDEFEQMTNKDPKPFEWASGLLSFHNPKPEDFPRVIESVFSRLQSAAQ